MSFLSDLHLSLVPLVFEEPHGYTMSYEVDRFDSGMVSGSMDMPVDREREVFHIKGISSEEAIYSGTYSILRRTLDYYFSGGQIRIYRMYPANLVVWSTSNEFGYSDIVQLSVGGASYPWFNSKMTITNFDIDGVSID